MYKKYENLKGKSTPKLLLLICEEYKMCFPLVLWIPQNENPVQSYGQKFNHIC